MEPNHNSAPTQTLPSPDGWQLAKILEMHRSTRMLERTRLSNLHTRHLTKLPRVSAKYFINPRAKSPFTNERASQYIDLSST